MKPRTLEQSLRILRRLWDKRLAPLNAPDAAQRLRSLMAKRSEQATTNKR